MDRQEKIAEARRLRATGWTLQRIAAHIGMSTSAVSRYCDGVLERREHPRQELIDQLGPKIRQMYAAGIPATRIAEQLGMHVVTVCEWMKRLGIKRQSRSVYVTQQMREQSRAQFTRDPDGSKKLEAARLYIEEQLSTIDIGKRMGLSAGTIGDWLGNMGIPKRNVVTLRTREKLRIVSTGEKRWNWKGGITSERVKLRTNLDAKLAREACFKRDDYTCLCCNVRGGKLNAHHVWPFQRFPEWKYEVWNLVTLCKRCHDAFHQAAGGPVHVAIGPFFHRKDEVREQPAVYEYRVAA